MNPRESLGGSADLKRAGSGDEIDEVVREFLSSHEQSYPLIMAERIKAVATSF